MIGSFAINNFMSQVPKREFYLGIMNVVEAVERIRIDQPIQPTNKKAGHLAVVATCG